MMPKNTILGPPSKSTGVQNDAQNRTFPQKGSRLTPDMTIFSVPATDLFPEIDSERILTDLVSIVA